MSNSPNTIRVVIPLTIRKRNGRPKILPPENVDAAEARAQDPRLLRAIGRAWGWRRKIESGEVATLSDIAKAEGVTVSFVSRLLRLAYLSPDVLQMLVTERRPCAVSIEALAKAVTLPWAEQVDAVFASHAQFPQDAHGPAPRS
jgi:hypothetical protein